MYRLYRTLTGLISPAIPTLLERRLRRGKEDGARLQERSGIASISRPQGRLVWIHAASVGESNSVLPLIEALVKHYPALHVLLTTVTVTSAQMMVKRLPERAFHQYAPVDTPQNVARFLEYWNPEVALWVDSEFWPNLIVQAKQGGSVLGIINARMSFQSYRTWRFAKGFIRDILSCFTLCFAQSEEDRQRLLALGVSCVNDVCNLKYDAPALAYDADLFSAMQAQIGQRPVWLAASTHPGEEVMIATMHKTLQSRFPDLLTIIVPRHARRGDEIVLEMTGVKAAQRSKNEPIQPDTDIYIADTMGELGLFYPLASIAFIGGTLVPHGGQNPLEAARIGCAIITGPHFFNFNEVVSGMQAGDAIITVNSAEELQVTLQSLLADKSRQGALAEAAMLHAQSRSGAINKIMNELQPYLT